MNIPKMLLENELITILPSVWNWEDAVKRGASLLVDKGFAKKEYKDAILKNTKENGPYYALIPNVVMPHARPEFGGIKSGVSLLIVKSGVKFHCENDPIYLILTVVSDTADNFSDEIMPSVAQFLENTALIEQLKKSNNSTEVKKILTMANEQVTKPTIVETSTADGPVINTPYFILTVCGVGMGSSLILRMTVEKVAKELKMINTKVEHTDISSASSIKADLILTTDEFANILKTKVTIPIGIVKNYMDIEEIKLRIQEKLF